MLKIVTIGPESTGKSSLCEQLAAHYQCDWCQEYAREYLEKHGMKYTYEDLLTIARGQIAAEERSIASATVKKHQQLFIDTDMYVMKTWCEFVFDNCHKFILEQIVERKYDLYLLCNIDLVWTQDGLREYPNRKTRGRLYSMYKDIMINQPVPWVEINGDVEQRLAYAIGAVDSLLNKS